MLPEKLQSTIVEKFSCSKCDMDFDLTETYKEHSKICETIMSKPGKVHFDHTYCKSFSSALSIKSNLLGTDKKVIQSPVKTVSEQIQYLKSNEMKTEVKQETFADFEALEQVGID